MVTEIRVLDLAWPAAEDLSNDKYRFVVLTSAGTVRRPDSEVEVAIGILQNAPASGEASAVRVIGASKLVMNDAIGIGTFVKTEYVSAADAGKGKDASGALAYARAICIEASGAEDDLGSVLLIGQVPGITQIAFEYGSPVTITTADVVTYTAAQLLSRLILRDPNGGARSDVTPTAALIVAGVPGAIVGSAFEFTIKNDADAAETITVTAGADVTLVGTMTIAQNNSKRFRAVITNIGGGTEAVTIYSLGTVVH